VYLPSTGLAALICLPLGIRSDALKIEKENKKSAIDAPFETPADSVGEDMGL
jgi:hypothetical protein